jgi:hypothetical protein
MIDFFSYLFNKFTDQISKIIATIHENILVFFRFFGDGNDTSR